MRYRRGNPSRLTSLQIDFLEERVVPTLLGQQLFPADYPWNQNIANAPVAANSAAIISHIGSSVKIHPDWGQDSSSNGSSPLYGIPYNVVHGNTTAKVNVIIDNYPGESDLAPVPIPAGAVVEGDYQNGPNPNGGGNNAGQRGDSHLIVWDEDSNVAYELYGATRPADPQLFPNTSGVELAHTDGLWHAAQESVWHMNTDAFRPLGYTSADAAGLSILAGLVRPDEGLPAAQGGQGAINHALRFTLPSGDVSPQYIYPASHVVNDSPGSTKLPFGSRLRLMNTPAVNARISAMGPQAQIIAHAMQQYGLVLADIGSAMYVTGSSAAQDANNSISLTWNMSDALGLAGLTAGDFQVIDLTPRVTGLSASSGSAGNTVTVIGQNFSGAAGHLSVYFGSTAATSVTFMDDAHLKVVVPSGSGTVHVTVQSGVMETDPNNPKDNLNNPIFGYGISTTGSTDQFTYTQLSGYQVTLAGGSTGPAGKGFAVAMQAVDQFGSPITSYSGPSTLTASISPTSAGSSFPATVAIGSNGFGLFLATVQQAGSYTLQVASGSLTGSAGVTITPGPAVKLGFAIQPASTPTGVVLSPVTVQVLDLYGNVVTTDSSDAVTLSVASGPGGFASGSTLTASAQNGVATFSNLKLASPGSYTLAAVVAGKYTGSNSSAFSIAPLQVVPGSFVGTPSGFSLRFNAPFLVSTTTPVLYGAGPATAPSVIVTTDPGNLNDRAAQVSGSLLLDPVNNAITYLATNTVLEAANGSPVLPDGTYTVIVRASAATNGFQALNPGAGFLDGRGTGTPGSGDFTATFTVSAAALQDDVVWLPATADGPGQPLRAPGDNQAGNGYPLFLSDRTGNVTDVQATLTYDPTLLNVAPSSTPTFTVTVPTPGTAVLHYSGPALAIGSRTAIGLLSATVPPGTAGSPIPYKARDLLHLSDVSLNGGAIPVTSSDAVHLVAYVGDADGNGSYSSNDAVLITRVALQADGGFAAFPLVDPIIVADTDGVGFIPADAALQVNEAGVGYPTANLANPPIPSGVYFQAMARNVAAEIAPASSNVVEVDGTGTPRARRDLFGVRPPRRTLRLSLDVIPAHLGWMQWSERP
jgi:hypothetical protein